jgi:hypothetical protein
MKIKNCVPGILIGISLLLMVAALLVPTPPPSAVPWAEVPKDGWTFVGRTERGTAIRKKYFKEHGIWIFVTATGPESISAVPVEILQRTQAGDSYK